MTRSHGRLGFIAAALACLVSSCTDGSGPGDGQPGIRYVAVAAGTGFACGLSDDGATYCWGGISTTDLVPVRLETPEPLVSIVASRGPMAKGLCGTTASGEALCWGQYFYGNDEIHVFDNPSEITGAAAVRGLEMGRGHACALAADSTVTCWGSYISGKRGVAWEGPGTTLADQVARPIPGASRFTMLAAGTSHSCGILADGQVACWGDSAMVGNPAASFIYDDNPCWLSPACRLTPVAGNGLTGVTSLAAGELHTCALAAQGVKCWGRNEADQLGAAGPNSPVPVTVPLPEAATMISAGGNHTCALGVSGRAICWGTTFSTAPTPPVFVASGTTRFVTLSAGSYFACGLTEAGAIYCWGEDGHALGNGSDASSETPVRVAEPLD